MPVICPTSNSHKRPSTRSTPLSRTDSTMERQHGIPIYSALPLHLPRLLRWKHHGGEETHSSNDFGDPTFRTHPCCDFRNSTRTPESWALARMRFEHDRLSPPMTHRTLGDD